MELFFLISGISIMFLGLVAIYNIAENVILRNDLNKYINNNNNFKKDE